jgi:hypothetical protein
LISPHEAIRQAKAGEISSQELLQHLVEGKVDVPAMDLPEIENGVITGWKPATLGKADGSQWLVAFTARELASAFMDKDPQYGFYVNVDMHWILLRALPKDHGIVFNVGSPEQLQWNAAGIAKYKTDVLGW